MAAGLPVGRALYLVFFALLSGCGGQSPPPFPPPEVSIATVRPRLVADWDDYTGRVQAVDTVEIRPRVAGYLSGVHFVEGALVEKGALLFTVDDREYLAAVEEARADLARAEARLEAAQKELTRADALIGQRAISQGEFDARQAEQRQARADQQAARAAVARADLHLSFTRIHAPIAGRAGEALATPGNLVVAGESLLTTVVSTDPVHVVFDAHEEAFLRYQRLPQQGKREVRIGNRRGGLSASRRAGFCGQRSQSVHGHAPQPSDRFQSGGQADARVVCPREVDGGPGDECPAGARAGAAD